jgi:hypothetical protein
MGNNIKSFIKKRIREEIIDGQNMSPIMETFCNKMSIPKEWFNADYERIIELVTDMIGPQNGENKAIWEKIHLPLKQWKQQETSINQQVKTEKMSGDSNPDNNTYWTEIQSTICEMGPDFE